MALNWETYNAIPRLYNYTEAKKWYDNIAPIRGCAGKTRPVGRRDQPWFSIWETGAGIHVGYGRDEELSKRQTLVLYHHGGTIQIHRKNRWSCASTNERLDRLLGGNFRTHQYDTWLRTKWHDNGVKRSGWLPLHCNGKRDWGADPAVSTFVRDAAGDLVYLDYVYPTTHKPNKVRMKEALAPFAGFMTFVEGLRKLQGGTLSFTVETQAEYFGWSEHTNYQGQTYPNTPPNLNWGFDMEGTRRQFLQWAASDDYDDRMKAAISMTNSRGGTSARSVLVDILLRLDNTLLDAVVHKEGKLVTDRYKSYTWA